MTERAVMRPVFGFSDGIFSIPMEKRAEVGITSIRCTLRVECGVCPDLDFRSIGAYPGERQCRGDIHVGQK